MSIHSSIHGVSKSLFPRRYKSGGIVLLILVVFELLGGENSISDSWSFNIAVNLGVHLGVYRLGSLGRHSWGCLHDSLVGIVWYKLSSSMAEKRRRCIGDSRCSHCVQVHQRTQTRVEVRHEGADS